MRRSVATGVLVLALAATAGCGGTGPAVTPLAPGNGPFGRGADRYWLWRPHGRPRAVVLFLHGLNISELNPANHHLPWIEHLAREGDDVVYPVYEARPGEVGALRHTLTAVDSALRRLGRPGAPFVIVGYSRGGRLAVDFAAVAPAIRVRPAAVMSVFPSVFAPSIDERVELGSIPLSTRILLAYGQEDFRGGVLELLDRLQQADFPPQNVKVVMIRSVGAFHAGHFSAFETGPEARRQLWAPLDQLVDWAGGRR